MLSDALQSKFNTINGSVNTNVTNALGNNLLGGIAASILTDKLQGLENKLVGKLASEEQKLLGKLDSKLQKLGLSASVSNQLINKLEQSINKKTSDKFFGGSTDKKGVTSDVVQASKEEVEEAKNFKTSEPSINKPNSEFVPLVFPPELQDIYLRIIISDYKRPTPKDKASYKTISTIKLPIPRNLEDKHDIDYNNIDLGFTGAVLGGSSGDLGDSAATAAAYAIGGNVIKSASFSNEIVAIAQQVTGAIPNPNISVAFRSPNLRRHRFDWMFAPNNMQEHDQVRNIIRKLQQAALPNFMSGSTNMLEYPKICNLALMPWAVKSTNYMYEFKQCMIESINVNYTPDNTPVFIDNFERPPAFIQMSINLIEIEYFTAQDYGLYSKNEASDMLKKLTDAITQGDLLSSPFDTDTKDENPSTVDKLPPGETLVASEAYRSADSKYFVKIGDEWFKYEDKDSGLLKVYGSPDLSEYSKIQSVFEVKKSEDGKVQPISLESEVVDLPQPKPPPRKSIDDLKKETSSFPSPQDK